jgi:hypothetical protein
MDYLGDTWVRWQDVAPLMKDAQPQADNSDEIASYTFICADCVKRIKES